MDRYAIVPIPKTTAIKVFFAVVIFSVLLTQVLSVLVITESFVNDSQKIESQYKGHLNGREAVTVLQANRPSHSAAIAVLSIISLLQALALLYMLYRREQKYRKAIKAYEEKCKFLEHQGRALDYIAIVGETDVRGNIVYANKNFCEVSGYSRDELIGQNHRIVNSGHHPKSYFEEMYRMIASKKVWRGEICNRKKDGEIYWVDTIIMPMFDDEDKIERYTAILFDVTEKKRDQEQIGLYAYEFEQANTELSGLLRTREELLAAVSHELRTPIACVKECMELISDGTVGTTNSEQTELLGLSSRNIDMLSRLVDDLLDAATIEAGHELSLLLESVNCYSMITEAANMLAHTANRKKQRIVGIVLDPSLTIAADRRRIMQVLLNLLTNAIKYSGDGGTISCSVERSRNGMVRVYVEDEGNGLSEEDRKHVFEKFYRARTLQTVNVEGFGLGLHLCKQIIEAHGGRIGCEAAPSRGCIFYFELPEKKIGQNLSIGAEYVETNFSS